MTRRLEMSKSRDNRRVQLSHDPTFILFRFDRLGLDEATR